MKKTNFGEVLNMLNGNKQSINFKELLSSLSDEELKSVYMLSLTGKFAHYNEIIQLVVKERIANSITGEELEAAVSILDSGRYSPLSLEEWMNKDLTLVNIKNILLRTKHELIRHACMIRLRNLFEDSEFEIIKEDLSYLIKDYIHLGNGVDEVLVERLSTMSKEVGLDKTPEFLEFILENSKTNNKES